ncbi:hypothetical protein Arnit_1003 [Arcobacter nitrofigilis DSM 7299]|uniref:Uncharacterized protein n=1 Tax=Arcobacter nitrofigilis (strain ATCC 33309 / DSM 7299 / CCUG 15893 / LMG 7604 / NCTC 12251 / CI) TaxID=572480 RepID=D5V384_ARCNC|nr:hypothetical protein [Arcobacter nitrofigilis]ADG92666.1 hypothetical protein Arnit_1003 [Arcobacter nitrofigilis DSM 7299]
MTNKLQVLLGFIGILIAFFAWQYPKQIEQLNSEKIISKSEVIKKANLKLLGSNLKVKIKEGKYFYSGGELNSTNSETTIYINNNQQLVIDVNGANIDLFIDESIKENIIVNNNGSNLKIKEI